MYDFAQALDALQMTGGLILPQNPIMEFLKLFEAGVIGLVVTHVRKQQRGRVFPLPLEHAMILLCLTGALMMIIIGDSLARALGIAGAATIVRFRTPVEDPRDTTLFLILLGLGMTCGVGSLTLAALAAVFVCGFLLFLNRTAQNSPRHLELEVVAQTKAFPASSVEKVLAASGATFELHEMAMDNRTSVTYLVNVRSDTDLKQLSNDLMASTQEGLHSVTWNEKKWMRQ